MISAYAVATAVMNIASAQEAGYSGNDAYQRRLNASARRLDEHKFYLYESLDDTVERWLTAGAQGESP